MLSSKLEDIMLSNVVSYFKSLFPAPVQIKDNLNPITELVLFDGDQCATPTLKALYKKVSTTKFFYASINISKINRKFCVDNGITLVSPFHVGKEATDTQIAITLVHELSVNPSIKRVHIVSNDGDFYDVTMNVSTYYPDIIFTIVSDGRLPMSRPAAAAFRKLEKNKNQKCFLVHVRT